MSNYKKTLADVKPGGMVRLGDQAELDRLEFQAWARWFVAPVERDEAGDYVSDFTRGLWCAWQAALAARQPVGEPVVVAHRYIQRYQSAEHSAWLSGDADETYVEAERQGLGRIERAYAAPPAQAVDLGCWSQRHADDLHVAVHTALSAHAGSFSQKKRAAISAYVKRLLIDSQTVEK